MAIANSLLDCKKNKTKCAKTDLVYEPLSQECRGLLEAVSVQDSDSQIESTFLFLFWFKAEFLNLNNRKNYTSNLKLNLGWRKNKSEIPQINESTLSWRTCYDEKPTHLGAGELQEREREKKIWKRKIARLEKMLAEAKHVK